MVKAGVVLLVLGGGTLAGYVLYLFFLGLYTKPDAPLIFKVATPVALVGFVLLVAAVIRDRLHARQRERFEGVEH